MNQSQLRALYEAERDQRLELEARLSELERAQQQLQSYAEDLRQTYTELRRRLAQMTILHEVSMAMVSLLDQERVAMLTMESLARLVPYERADLYITDAHDHQTTIYAVRLAQQEVTTERGGKPSEQASEAIRTGQPVVSDRTVAIPLRAGRGTVGALQVCLPEPLADGDLQIIELVAGAAALAVANAQLYQETQRLASTDALTGLHNFRHFRDALAREVERARRLGYPLGLIIADIDHFKRINDCFGHDVGNEVLRKVAQAISSQLRKTDVVARVGGEEFVALLPGCNLPSVKVVAEKVRLAVAALHMPVGESSLSVTISVGGASHPPQEAEADRLLKQADQALYRAKRRGRNRSCIWDRRTERVARVRPKDCY